MKKKTKIGILLLAVLLFSVSCGKRMSKTYVDDQRNMLYAFSHENYGRALSFANKSVLKMNKSHAQDVYVALLERATCALAANRFDIAIKDFQKAESRFLDIEGTISISEEGSSLFLDDTTKEYEAEPLEKIMISPYLALAYWGKGDFNGARIERNRTITKINQYIETKGGSGYLENPFARYLSAIIYENEGKFQDARIEYRKISKTKKFTSALMNEHIRALRKRPQLSDLVVFVDLGKAPIKHEKAYKGYGRNSKGSSILVKIVYPVYKPRRYMAKRCQVLLNGKVVAETSLLYNLSATILAQFKKNHSKLVKSLVARAALKVATQAVGNTLSKSKKGALKAVGTALSIFSKVSSAIERADLRSWLTLPAEVQVARARAIPSGEYTLELVYLDASGNRVGKSKPEKVVVKKGEISVAHFRVAK